MPDLQPSLDFESGRAHAENIGHYLDCSSNPYDLRPARDLIIQAAYALREKTPNNKPVVIVIGEPHRMSSRLALIQMVTSSLLASENRLTVSLENEHNKWSHIASRAERGMGMHIPSGLFYMPQKYDTGGQALLSADLGFEGIDGASVAYDNFLAFCLRKEIPTIYSEAAKDDLGNLDMRDSVTASIVTQYLQVSDV